MSKYVFGRAILVALLMGVGIASRSLAADDPPVAANGPASELTPVGSEASVRAALAKTVSITAANQLLSKVIKDLSSQVDLTMQLDTTALDSIGFSPDEATISVALQDISLGSVLRTVLREFDLTYMYHQGVLMITTQEEAEANLVTNIYEVVDLISTGDVERPDHFDYDSLIELITSTVDADSWDEVGGPGSISGFRGTLVVSQTVDVQGRIQQLLAAARTAKKIAAEHKDKAPPSASIPLAGTVDDAKGLARIEKALDSEATFEFTASPLKDVVAAVSKLHDIPVILDRPALEDAGLENTTPITISLRKLQLRQALSLMLRELELSWIVSDSVLVVTTREASEQRLTTRAYPVLDLVDLVPKNRDFASLAAGSNYDFASLIELTTAIIAPHSWDEVGGPAAIGVMGAYGFFVVNQTYENHQQLEAFYTNLRGTIPAEAKTVAKREDDGRLRLAVYLLPGARPEAKATSKTTQEKPEAKVLQQFGGGMGGMGGGMGGMGGGGMQDSLNYAEAPSGEQMLDLITALIEPESWNEREDVFARAVNSRLVIRHTESVHRQIRELAAHLGIRNFSEVPTSQRDGRGAGATRSGGFF